MVLVPDEHGPPEHAAPASPAQHTAGEVHVVPPQAIPVEAASGFPTSDTTSAGPASVGALPSAAASDIASAVTPLSHTPPSQVVATSKEPRPETTAHPPKALAKSAVT
jgi:hypothetical protein